MSTTKTNVTSKSVSKPKESTRKSSRGPGDLPVQKATKEVDPIADEVKKRYSTGLYNVNQLAAQFMVHASRIEKILGK